MRAARLISWTSLLAGLASLVFAGLQGDLDVFLVLVVPVVTGAGPWAALGFLATIAGLVGLFWTSAPVRQLGAPQRAPEPGHRPEASQREDEEPPAEERSTRSRGGGVILIGPIPIAWGSDRSTLSWLVVGGIVLTLAAIGLTLLARS